MLVLSSSTIAHMTNSGWIKKAFSTRIRRRGTGRFSRWRCGRDYSQNVPRPEDCPIKCGSPSESTS